MIDSNRGTDNISAIVLKDECSMYKTGLYSMRVLAEEYNVCGYIIRKIKYKYFEGE